MIGTCRGRGYGDGVVGDRCCGFAGLEVRIGLRQGRRREHLERGEPTTEIVAARLHNNPESDTTTTILATTTDVEGTQSVAARITAATESDPRFAAEVERLITAVRQACATDLFVAQAFDRARQVNIRGDNTGTVSLS